MTQALKVAFQEGEGVKTFVGQDLVAHFVVTNASEQQRRVAVTMTARHTQYWDRSGGDENIVKQTFDNCVLPKGQGIFSLPF